MKEGIVRIIQDKKRWNAFVLKNTSETFHQSWEWGDAYKKTHNRIWRIAFCDCKGMLACCLVVKIQAKRGSFLLIPHGPIFHKDTKKTPHKRRAHVMAMLQKQLVELARNEGVSFIRVAPILERTPENAMIFKNLGYRNAPIFVQSEQSWVLNITPDSEALLKNMRKSTRYILRREKEYGLTMKKSTSPADLNLFFNLYNKTVENKGFVGQDCSFIKAEFESFVQSGAAALFFAYKDDVPVSVALIISQGKTAFYHYGASLRLKDNTPAPHVLQWHIIKHYKAYRFLRYNFWGVAPQDKPSHPWSGLSLFKKGFGGEEHKYVQTQDYVLQWAYWINWIVEVLRKIRRGY